ncbi:3-oxoacid CoA-transferase [Pseudonocardia acaciae]|uniref:3-oxoacid CoA-transferase n=1 Tax=Pseudonocardia acaciae TaxID=551276 RepID=UPI000ABB4CFA|nr:3-oxoacid CoA-transferase subunit A [Pseudonocardia acaciae]
MPQDKIVASASSAVADVPDGASIAIAGFGVTHSFPCTLTVALRKAGPRHLRLVANSLGENELRSISLVENDQVDSLVVSFSGRAGGGTSSAERMVADGRLQLELCPQGTLVERLRAAGAGIGAFFTRTGVNTAIAEGKEVRRLNGVDHVLETALPVDYSLIRGFRGDRFGNIQFRGNGANFMPAFAKAGRVVIVEVDEVVDEIAPEDVDLPGVFVDRVVRTDLTLPVDFIASQRKAPTTRASYDGRPAWSRAEMAEVAADMLPDPSYVNLGLGIPTLISNYIDGRDIQLHAENGILGYGELAPTDDYDKDIFNAAGEYVRLRPGASFFESVESFEMVRGGHIDVVVLGAYEVDAEGSIANWSRPLVGGAIGGAMDLVASGRDVMVMLTHLSSKGRPKLVRKCGLPLTGARCVTSVVTDIAAMRRVDDTYVVERVAPGFTRDDVVRMTDFPLDFA